MRPARSAPLQVLGFLLVSLALGGAFALGLRVPRSAPSRVGPGPSPATGRLREHLGLAQFKEQLRAPEDAAAAASLVSRFVELRRKCKPTGAVRLVSRMTRALDTGEEFDSVLLLSMRADWSRLRLDLQTPGHEHLVYLAELAGARPRRIDVYSPAEGRLWHMKTDAPDAGAADDGSAIAIGDIPRRRGAGVQFPPGGGSEGRGVE